MSNGHLKHVLDGLSLGEHNEEILSTYLSYTPEQVQTLESEGVLKRAG